MAGSVACNLPSFDQAIQHSISMFPRSGVISGMQLPRRGDRRQPAVVSSQPDFLELAHAATSLSAPHISGRLARTRASANGGGTALPQRATCLSLAYFLPR